MNLENSKLVIASQEAMRKLNWTPNANQRISPIGSSLDDYKLYCYNRAVTERGGKYYVKPRKGKQIEVEKISEDKFEVML